MPFAIIPDNAGAFFMSRGKIDLMITGADRIAANGDAANKIGTLGLAVCAGEFGVPFYIAAPVSTFDLSIGKRFGDNWTISANAVNIANTSYLLDTSNTFGGTHFVNPRQIYGEVRYRFHY